MQERISSPQVIGALQEAIKKLDEKKRELDRLDSPIGDGDHGRTISNAFQKASPLLQSEEGEDIGAFLKKLGRTLALSTGAAAGPLYGTGFMEAGRAVAGKNELKVNDLVDIARGFEEGVKRRGKAEVGEKTMLDTIHPVVESLEESVSESLSLNDALKAAKEAAYKGMQSTKELVSQRGRSSRLGERTKGHIDPGAASCYYIIEAVVDYLVSELSD